MKFEHYPLMSDAFEEALDFQRMEHECEFQETLEDLSKDGIALWDLVSNAAERMKVGVEELTTGKYHSTDELRAALEVLPQGPFNHEHLVLISIIYAMFNLGERAVKQLKVAEGRFLDLVLLSRTLNPMPPARRFLRRVSQCYLYGFDTECIIMCGAVLESTLKSQVPPDDGTMGKAKRERIRMNDRIAIAVSSGRLTQDLATNAHRIRDARNEAAHSDA